MSGLSRSHAFVLRFIISVNLRFVNRHNSTKYPVKPHTHLVHQTILRRRGREGVESSPRRQMSVCGICAKGRSRQQAAQKTPGGDSKSKRPTLLHPLLLLQNAADVRIQTDRLTFDLPQASRLALIDTCVNGVGVLRRHLPEGVFDNNRGVIAHTQLQE